MVSAGVCYGGKERLHFIPDKAKVIGKLYCETVSFVVWFHIPGGQSACSDGKAGSKLDYQYCQQQ